MILYMEMSVSDDMDVKNCWLHCLIEKVYWIEIRAIELYCTRRKWYKPPRVDNATIVDIERDIESYNGHIFKK